MHWLYLAIAIFAEVIGTTALKASDGLTRFKPSVIVVIGYALAFYFLALSLRSLSVGVAYAIWAGIGMALIALAGWLVYGEQVDAWGAVGILLIIAGVIVLQTFSRMSMQYPV